MFMYVLIGLYTRFRQGQLMEELGFQKLCNVCKYTVFGYVGLLWDKLEIGMEYGLVSMLG